MFFGLAKFSTFIFLNFKRVYIFNKENYFNSLMCKYLVGLSFSCFCSYWKTTSASACYQFVILGNMSEVRNKMDFIQLLGPDMSIKILTHLDDPCDLVRVSAVSSSWHRFGKRHLSFNCLQC